MKTQMLSMKDASGLALALGILKNGGVVAFATDTVYGLGALVSDEKTIALLYEVKERPAEKSIPILIGDFAQVTQVASSVPPMAEKLAQQFWPGPLTMVLPRHPSIPDAVTTLPTVGVRIPALNAARALLRLTGPMAVTSANISGQNSPSSAAEVEHQLGGRIPLILDGGTTPGGIPSTLVDCTGEQPVILREGPVSLQAILQALA